MTLQEKNLRNRQNRLDKMFEEEGLTDEILKEQIRINQKRNELDIPDENEIDGEYVQ